MVAVNAAFGLRPESNSMGYGTRGVRCLIGALPSAYNTAIYQHQPIKMLGTGYIAPVSATSDAFIGAFIGVEYTDATGKRVVSNQWLANTAATDIRVYFTDDVSTIYEIQSDGSLAQSAIGEQAYITNLTANNGLGMSQATISATTVNSGTRQLRIIDISQDLNNASGDTYTVVRVQISNHQNAAAVTAY